MSSTTKVATLALPVLLATIGYFLFSSAASHEGPEVDNAFDLSTWETHVDTSHEEAGLPSCGFSYQYPSDWISRGSTLLSPERIQAEQEFVESHPDLVAEGEGGSGSVPNMVISCYPDIHSYLGQFFDAPYYQAFSERLTLADVFVDGKLFLSEGNGLMVVKTLTVGGEPAIEVTGIRSQQSYSLLIEAGGHIYEISLQGVEYDQLSAVEKQILATITFAK